MSDPTTPPAAPVGAASAPPQATAPPPSLAPPPPLAAPPLRLSEGSPLGRLLDLVDRAADAGRSKTMAVQRAARIGRRLPSLLFGAVVALAGVGFLVLAALRGLVEITAALFSQPKPWVAWVGAGGILLVSAVFIGTVRNDARRTPPT